VTATVRNPDLRDRVAGLGATVIPPEGFGERGPFEVILELVGAVNLTDNLNSLETGGRLSVIGMGAGSRGEINLGILLMKRGRIHGSTLRSRPLEQKAATARAMERSVLPLLASGVVKVPIAETYPLNQAPAAYEHFQAGGKLGKIVLVVE
jgi:NADPH:quinone reductase-like Zn-dependent oxidoreductase